MHIGKLSDFVPQRKNANRHTARGMGLLEDSMSQDGYVAPMTATADGEVIDGSARLEKSALVFSDSDEAIIVEHDGRLPIVMKRTDIENAEDPRAKSIALRANRIAEVNLDFDPIILKELSRDLDLSSLWNEEEMKNIEVTLPNLESEKQVGFDKKKKVTCPECGHEFEPK